MTSYLVSICPDLGKDENLLLLLRETTNLLDENVYQLVIENKIYYNSKRKN